MNSLPSQQMWELMRDHQAELLKEAQRVRLANMAKQPQANWFRNLFGHQAQEPALPLNPSAAPELG